MKILLEANCKISVISCCQSLLLKLKLLLAATVIFYVSCNDTRENVKMTLVDTYEREGKYSEAISLLDGILRSDSFNIDALVKRAEIYTLTERDQLAEIDYRQVLRVDAKNVLATYGIANSFYLRDKLPDALVWVNKAEAIKGDDSVYIAYERNANTEKYLKFDLAMAQIRFLRAKIHYQSLHYRDAYKDFLFCLQNDYNQKECYLYMGAMNVTSGQKDEGCRQLQKASSLGDTSAKTMLRNFCK
jgi:tetratricopeptide (TPR) repeat protein